jgi:hypothetical protein
LSQHVTAPFIDGDSSEYFCSIVRFSIQTANSLPIFIPLIDNTAADINTTIYKISSVWTKTGSSPITTTTNLMFTPTIPYTNGSPLPYNYYYMYNYSELMNMINSAFNKLFTTGAIASAIAAFTTNSFAPFIEIDPNTFKMQYYRRQAVFC